MKFSIDNGKTWAKAENVRVIYDDIDVPGEDEKGEFHVNLTHEGIITDVYVADKFLAYIDLAPTITTLAPEVKRSMK